MLVLLGYLILGVVCGFICESIASNRGMEGGFWWGFFLDILGVIIVALRPNDQVSPKNESERHESEIIALGGWRCNNCGKANYPYVEECTCGWKKGTPAPSMQRNPSISSKEKITGTESLAEEIKKYRALANDGIITQEEFEAKKKQLLGL